MPLLSNPGLVLPPLCHQRHHVMRALRIGLLIRPSAPLWEGISVMMDLFLHGTPAFPYPGGGMKWLGCPLAPGMLSGQGCISQGSTSHGHSCDGKRLFHWAATKELLETLLDDTNQPCFIHQTWFPQASIAWHQTGKRGSSQTSRKRWRGKMVEE